MAELLSNAAQDGTNVTRATLLEFINWHEDAEDEIADAQETVRARRKVLKDLRKTIVASGVNLAAFDRARIDAKRSGEERDAEEAKYIQYMAWQRKPVNFQASMDLVTSDPAIAAFNVHELHAIDTDGMEAGKGGRPRQSNPHSPGSEAFQRFDVAWMRGQAQIADSMAPGAPAASGEKRKPGRPRKDAPPATAAPEVEAEPQTEAVH